MKNLLLAFLLLISPAAFAVDAMIYQNESMTVRLMKTECENGAVQEFVSGPLAIQLGLKGPWYAGNVLWQGKLIGLCWTPVDQEHIFVVDETGDGGSVLISLFKPDEGI